MTRYEGSFEIDSKADAYAAQRILEQAYDTIREESRAVRAGAADGDELLREFAALRDAAQPPASGTLTITYERDEADE